MICFLLAAEYVRFFLGLAVPAAALDFLPLVVVPVASCAGMEAATLPDEGKGYTIPAAAAAAA